jgi:hypothetical protein
MGQWQIIVVIGLAGLQNKIEGVNSEKETGVDPQRAVFADLLEFRVHQETLGLSRLKIVPNTARDAMPIRMNAARKAKQSRSPSSSIYASAIRMTKTAGAILLKGIGVRSNAAVSRRTAMPTKRLATSKASGQRG